ncbi:hypothetical protein Pmar_PMAR015925 [Perkinsus marinus ATCC 50983]|uniref:Uncharacterized protein n=1 Tax=Perkinsus marinus (strain ATCC 50983 / TXsc) TaxID=423536 RepID=C5L440_PERM5|nr:hypothetical protein Pmar_PMAR015925 [Perkinsus marinus ATCC 50983]EER08506.1 hypothetical protein Pmar_PMAR015925 [Perkinsus marinus ATCC 50983]|eukprot:XP_002776690.1 hypothetical protein Pmar_PMAR015925 [Perkinsus marinus ATCC 50983]
MASRERITHLIPNPDAMRRRESTREWRYSQPDGNPNKRFRDDGDIIKMRAKLPRVTPLYEAEILHGEFGVKYAGNWSEEANTWLVEVKPICIVLGEKIVEKIPEEEISILEDSILCNICDVFVETAGISDNALRDIEAEHRSDPVHLTQREKMRKRFGICEAFNKEIEKIKSHRIKLAISANGYPRQ